MENEYNILKENNSKLEKEINNIMKENKNIIREKNSSHDEK